MATTNTGYAAYKLLTITATIAGVPTVYTESILNAIPNTSFGRIEPAAFVLLTLPQAQARYTAFEAYLFAKYPGFVAANITNQSISYNSTLCPI